MPGQMKIISASGDHTARLWQITESKFVMLNEYIGHTRSVKTAAFRRNDSAVFATGGRDGAIRIWDTRAKLNIDSVAKADNCINSGHSMDSNTGPTTPNSSSRRRNNSRSLTPSRQTAKMFSQSLTSSSITGLSFQDDHTLVSCGAGDGVIKLWDLRRNYSCFKKEPLPKHTLTYAGSSALKGFTNLLIDNSGMRLYVNCMDNNIYCYNISSYSNEPIKCYKGFTNKTFYIKSCLSPDGQYLVSGSSDEKAYIWNVNYSEPILSLNGHTVEVTCVAWSNQSNDIRVVTCSDDARHKIWKIGPEEINDDEKIYYKGFSEECKYYYCENNRVKKLKTLESTPRSLKRLIEKNEKTPTTIEKLPPSKRSFSEMSEGAAPIEEEKVQREPKGRRLFGPSTSYAQENQGSSKLSNLATVIEENSPDSKNRLLLSPLTERTEDNLKSPENLPSTSSSSISRSLIFSPTSNLPNFVIDGEAPHLRVISPKRKLKENVDWLTKIRKQKLLSSNSHAKLFAVDNNHSSTSDDDHNHMNSDVAMSPRVQKLKSSEYSPSGTPKRRTSRSGSNEHGTSPSSSRNNRRQSTETSILRFFTLTQPTK